MKKVARVLSVNRRQDLERRLSRAKNLTLHGTTPNREPWSAHLSRVIGDALAFDADPPEEELQRLGQLYNRAHKGDLTAKQELNALKLEQTQNYMLPNLNFGGFFQIIQLADNESPAIQNNTKQEFKARYLGQDGGVETTKVIPAQTETLVDLHELVTDEAEYRIRDLYTGNIQDAAEVTFDLNFDLENQLEAKMVTLLFSTLGAFTLTGKRSTRTAVLNSRIRSGVIPASNQLQVSDIAADSKFSPKVFDAALDYCLRWGRDSQGELMPTGEVIVPADEIIQIGSAISFFGAKPTEVAERILRDGWLDIGRYLGVDWRLIPDNTIAQKKCYVRLNRPAAILWLKPGMDDSDEKVDRKRNRASRWIKKVVGMAQPEPWKKHFLEVAYRS